MATFLIDYENVHHHGLYGIEKLKEDDYIVIFVGNKNDKIPLDTAISLSKTKATIVWKKSEKTAPNYLDIQLASYLGSLVGENKGEEFFIISKDKGFLAAVDFWRPRKTRMRFELKETISGKTIAEISQTNHQKNNTETTSSSNNDRDIKDSLKKKISAVITKYNLIGGNFTKVYSIFKKSKDEDQFLSVIRSSYQGDKYKNLANELLPIYKEYLSLSS